MERKDVPDWPGVSVTKDGVAWLTTAGRAVPIAQRHKGMVTIVFQTDAGPISKSTSIKTLVALAWNEEPVKETGATAKKKKGHASDRGIQTADVKPEDDKPDPVPDV